MKQRGRAWILLAAQRIAVCLVWLYPPSFRRRYGAEMTRAFAEIVRERYGRAGPRGLLWLGVRALADTLGAAVREHLAAFQQRAARFHHAGRGRGALAEDLRHAVRYLLRQPGFSLAIVATLALGIGANTAIFSVIYAALLRPLPFEDGERLVILSHQLADGDSPAFSLRELAALRRSSRNLDRVEEYHSMSFILLGHLKPGRVAPERVVTGVVSSGYFDLLDVEPHLGRTFNGDDARQAVLVLSHEYWLEHLGGDPGVVGRRVEMNDRDHTIIGVLPPLPAFPERFDVFMPTTSCPFRRRHLETDPDARITFLLGRLAPGATLEDARAEAGRVLSGLEAESARPAAHRSRGVRIVPVSDVLARNARPTFVVLLATAAFVLLIVFANAANLTLARLARRDRELVVRKVLDAGRGRLARQLTVESLVLASLGGLVAVAACSRMLDALGAFAARFTVRAAEVRLDTPVLLMALALVLAVGTALGLLPFWPGCRRLAESLCNGAGGRFPAYRRHRLQRLLVVAQLAASFVLVAGAGLMLRSMVKLQDVDPGFHSDNVLTLSLDLNWSRYDSPEKYLGFFTRLLDQLAARPEIESAAVAETFPLHELKPERGRILVEGRTLEDAPRVDLRAVSDDYFKTLGIELRDGHGFDCADGPDAPPVVIVNSSLGRRYFGADSPVGRRVSIDDGASWATIAGVVGDVKQHGLDSEVRDEVYVSLRHQVSRVMTLLVRTRADPHRVAREMWQSVYDIDPQQAVAHLRSLKQIRRDALAPPRLTTLMLSLFAVAALGLTATGISGVLSLSVSQRTREIGLRMALGARRESVLWMVMGDGMGLALAGSVLGLCAALALSRSMSELLYGVEPTDPWTLAATAVLLLAVAAAACFVPARWATGVQPGEALRQP